MRNRKILSFMSILLLLVALGWGVRQVRAQQGSNGQGSAQQTQHKLRSTTAAQRKAAAARAAAARAAVAAQAKLGQPAASTAGGMAVIMAVPTPGGTPDYFGTTPNWAYSPVPIDPTMGALSGGIRKFVDSLPGLGSGHANNRGEYIPIATPITPPTGVPNDGDYYDIALFEFNQKLHSDLPATRLRGYADLGSLTDKNPHYLGPLIIADKNRPVRIKFSNLLPAGSSLFLPMDTSIMGAGMGPDGTSYSPNRATLHLHGGNTPWISDGTPHQWTVPAGEGTSYPKGVSTKNVPDMPNPGPGALTFYYPNQQSGRLMFYHDHAYGITRLNVYAGEAAGYLLVDPVEEGLINSGVLPNQGDPNGVYRYGIPLIIQDKTFVDAAKIVTQDPTWNWGTTPGTPKTGDLWLPHVYMPNQNPFDLAGVNAMGRWDYGPWFWPPFTGLANGPVANPYYDPANAPWEPPQIPGTPNPSIVPEAFLDTPLVNGQVYPYLTVEPRAYRFRILNACNDRFLNLQLYYADPAVLTADGRSNTEVRMVPAVSTAGYPATWPSDGRAGGVPDPSTSGPSMIQIGSEGGFLPAPVVLPNQPIDYIYNRRDITVLNIGPMSHTLLLGPAERADIILDFSGVPAGSTLILYNDAPAPVPAFDPRNDYYTGDPDQTDTGGAPSTLPGYGPNTRTILQFRVDGPVDNSFSLPALQDAFKSTGTTTGAFATAQDPIIVAQADYNSAYNATFPNDTRAYVRIQDNTMTFTTVDGRTMTKFPLEPKAIQELFEPNYGRMDAILGVERPNTNATIQTTIPYFYIDPATEIIKDSSTTSMTPMAPVAGDGTQIWKITHNGVDTHAIHFHLFNVQLINRVGWDGAVRPPEPNELGWKETVRMNPLEDAIVALRPLKQSLPWSLPNSIRPLDVTSPIGATTGFTNVDPNGNPISISNQMTNFGWEYVWHCHLLGHEENDMMRPLILAVAPDFPPSNLVATGLGGPLRVQLTWKDNSNNETSFTVQRATDSAFTLGLTALTVGANVTTLTDTSVAPNTTYYYRVFASNVVGTAQVATMSADSAPSSAVLAGPPAAAPTIQSANQPGVANNAPVVLNWSDNSPNVANPPNFNAETSFTVQRSANGGGTWINVATLPAHAGTGAMTYTDPSNGPNGVKRRTTYTYRIQANNMFGSTTSNTVAITTR